MGKCERSLSKRVAAIMLAVMSLVWLTGCKSLSPAAEETQTSAMTAETQMSATAADVQLPETMTPTEARVVFPVQLENGQIEIGSLFQLDGINPDCQYEEGTDIGAIEITNTSEDFLVEARICAKLSDGTQADFLVTNLPAGKSAVAFAVDNAALGAEVSCEDLTCEAVWLQEDPMPESVTAVSDGMLITLTNNTDQNISELIIYCRCPFDAAYYGGIAYEYTVNDIPAHGQATVEALDCILGMAEAVRIAVK